MRMSRLGLRFAWPFAALRARNFASAASLLDVMEPPAHANVFLGRHGVAFREMFFSFSKRLIRNASTSSPFIAPQGRMKAAAIDPSLCLCGYQ